MKTITLFLFILILTTACTPPEPAADPILITRTTDAPTTPANTPASEEPAPTAVLPTVTANSTTLTPQTFLWVIESGERLGNFYLVKRSADEGLELWRTQFQQAQGIAIDPHDGSVWTIAGTSQFETSLVKVDTNGNIIQQLPGFDGVFALDPNDGSLWVSLVPPCGRRLGRQITTSVMRSRSLTTSPGMA
jgi:hypothetical protein